MNDEEPSQPDRDAVHIMASGRELTLWRPCQFAVGNGDGIGREHGNSVSCVVLMQTPT